MQIKEGMVVKSYAGHDQGRFYLVVKISCDKAYIADGKRRKLEKPKQKSFKHLKRTNTVLDISLFKTNQMIRRELHRFNNEAESVAN